MQCLATARCAPLTSPVPLVAMLAIWFAGMLSPVCAASSVAASPDMKKPTIVLVHGAFADSSSWDAVISPLLAEGYAVVAASNPLRGLKSDAAYVAAVLKRLEGPIVLVGHSYGGAVISNAADGNTNVKALVYVAGFAPDAGETCADLAGRFPGGTLGTALVPPTILSDGGRELSIRQSDFPKQFAADVSLAQAERMAVTQRPIVEAALNEPAGPPAWKRLPSWFIFGASDKNIPAGSHRFMADRAAAKRVVEIDGASHVVMISRSDAVVQIIREAAGLAGGAHAPPSDTLQKTAFDPAPVVPLATEPPARLAVDAPLPEQLARGYVVIRYRSLHARLMPVYGPSAAGVSPRLGHLHITVDDLPWRWLDASGEPLSINGLAPGPHKVLLELVDTAHRVMDSATVHFQIPTPELPPR